MNARHAAAGPARCSTPPRPASTRALDALIAFEAAQDPAVDATVAAIIADVRARGDAARARVHARASTASTAPRSPQLEIAPAEMQRAFDGAAGRRSATRSRRPRRASARYHERQKLASWSLRARRTAPSSASGDAARPRRPLRARRQGGVSVVGADERDSGARSPACGEIVMVVPDAGRRAQSAGARRRASRRRRRASSRSAARRRSPRSRTARRRFPRSTRSAAPATPTSPRPSAACSARSASTWSRARPRSW